MVRRLGFAICWLFISASLTASADLPSEARADIDQGLSALAQRDYSAAERSVSDAFNKAKEAEVCRAIGDAEAKIPGRELRAAIWLLGYLGQKAAPADAAQVRRTIDALAAASRERISRLVAQEAGEARQKPDGDARDETLRDVASSWGILGDFAKAQQIIDLIKAAPEKSEALITLARAQADAAGDLAVNGDWAGAATMLDAAQKSTDAVPFPHARGEGRYGIVMAHVTFARVRIAHGDLSLARDELAAAQHVADVTDDWYSESEQSIATTLLSQAKAQAKAGDPAAARATLQVAAKTTALITKSMAWQYDVLMDLADAWIRIGDPARARPVLRQALALVTVYNDPDDERLQVACAQARAGDADGVGKTLEQISDSRIKARARQAIDGIRRGAPKAWPIEDPPFSSDELMQSTLSSRLGPESCLFEMENGFDAPWFTAYPDFSNYLEMGEEIEKTPVRNGQQPAYRQGDRSYALRMVIHTFTWAQRGVDHMIRANSAP
jgi:hypothetical protein